MLIREGVALRAQGRDAEAMERFRAAWIASPTPRARAQMGWAAQALGRWRDAEAMLSEALSARDDAWIAANRADLGRSLADVASRLGSLEVRCDVSGARVIVDGEVVGTTPLSVPLRAPAGSVNVRVEADGYIAVTREGVRIRVGEVARERFGLTPEPVTRTRVEAPPPAATGAAPATTSTSPLAPSPSIATPSRGASPTASTSPLRIAGYATLAVGGAALITSGVLSLTRESAVDRYSDGVRRGECAGVDRPAAEETSQACRDDREAASQQDTLRWVFLGLGAAGVGAGIVMALLAPSSTQGRAMTCAAWGDLRGLSCALRF